ncbi:RES family NAD+ phosphorylase [Alcanivorax sediminis]|uniref:RES domain-containing protein n=1 Tax=Alcanivorax sediminis TaxID=2663008 RepID=A0A6N7M0G9_9GAMM|nr:RES family NAD+ phosphorylase [Alcanivorax sediminis]MQX53760.1 RES domain-containing protein [Alcanivorax sediminis]
MGVNINDLPHTAFQQQTAYRLVNSKYPPIHIFDDVADQTDFDALFAVQALTNPRLQQQVGQLNRVPEEQRPWGIPGCNYALGPFVHINPAGSRFSNGDFGVYYCADHINTAIAETRYHQQRYFQNIDGLKYDRIVMCGLRTAFSAHLVDITPADDYTHWHASEDYSEAQRLGANLRQREEPGIHYESVRSPGNACFALLTPKPISEVIPTSHYEYVWDGEKIAHTLTIRRLS